MCEGISFRDAAFQDELAQHVRAVYRRVHHVCAILHTPLYSRGYFIIRQMSEPIQVGIHIAYTLGIQVLWRRSLEMLNTLEEQDTSSRLISSYCLEELISALRLICLTKRLWGGAGDGTIVSPSPWRCIVDRGLRREVPRY